MRRAINSTHSAASPKRVAVLKAPLLHEGAADVLRNMIIEGDLSPGARLPEIELCELLGISRTPLREALKVLATEGFVTLTPQRGAMVTEPDVDQLEATVEAVALLEASAGRLACARASDRELQLILALHKQMIEYAKAGNAVRYFRTNQKFHDSVVLAAHNDVLARTHAGLNAHLKRLRYKKMHSRTPEMRAHFIEEHEAIAQALMRREGEVVYSEIKRHLARVGAMLGAPD